MGGVIDARVGVGFACDCIAPVGCQLVLSGEPIAMEK